MKIMMVGNAKTVKGGINSVITSLHNCLLSNKPELVVRRFPSYIDKGPGFIRILYSLGAIGLFMFQAIPYQVIHLHSADDGSFYRKTIFTFLSKAFGKTVVFHLHGAHFEAFRHKSKFHIWLVRKVLNRADAIVVLSEQMKLLVARFCDNRAVHVLPNPIQLPDRIDRSEKSAKERVNLLFLGEIGQRKGVYDLLRAVASLSEETKNRILLHVCGNNEIEQARTMASELKLDECCIVHGWVDGDQKKHHLTAADVFLLPSYAEGLPVSILEAMAYSLPIISTNIAGIPEVVRTGVNGVLIEPGDVQALADAISLLASDDNLRLEYGTNSRKMVEKHDVRKVVDDLAEIYTSNH